MFHKTFCVFTLLFLTAIICVKGCDTLPVRPTQEKDGRCYGVTDGLFRHRWWNYYERALSFAEGGFLEEAELDLEKAIRLRKDDKWRARTYGMHFVNYFPHCELGVIRYKEKDWNAAVKELETSLKTAKNAKAEFWLDLARKALIEKTQSDKEQPEIIIDSPQQPFLTKDFSVVIRGTAKDDQFVRHVTVNGKKIRVDVSDKKIPFRLEVPVSPGENRIPVVAADLTGKLSQTEVVVIHVDRTGPTVSIDAISDYAPIAKRAFAVKGYAFDASGVAEVIINGRKMRYDGSEEIQFHRTLHLGPEEKQLVIEARDRPGNVTLATVNLSEMVNGRERENLLAENTVSEKSVLSDRPGMLAYSDSSEEIPPEISLHNTDEERITYLDYAVIDGKVTGNIKYLRINGKNLLGTPRRGCYFNHLVQLKKDENIINTIYIEAISSSGYSDDKKIKVRWRKPNALRLRSRLRIAVRDFEASESEKEKLTTKFEEYLVRAMSIHKRFFDPQSLKVKSDELDEGAVQKKAGDKNFDCILFSEITESNNSVHIFARLKDTENGSPIVENVDVFDNEMDSIERLVLLTEVMSYKLTDELPVVKGTVEKVERTYITVDIGKEEKVREGMRLLVYELDPRDETLGQAEIESVEEKKSDADLLDKKPDKEIKKGDHVITR
ncbi:MAG: hypothetical protein DRI57_26325 [Deltaproteobacteria bacterium]|nr:MAG: hypothetical protein DRI57_26325 [Deltaproteobacteria bacterium]